MKQYTIEMFYCTSGTFGSKDIVNEIGYSWNNLDTAKENLKRIKYHYEWYTNRYKSFSSINKRKIRRPQFVPKEWSTGIILLDDDGTEIDAIHTFWCTHFETLFHAKIKKVENPDLIYVTPDGEHRLIEC
jgi:hypothetical protein